MPQEPLQTLLLVLDPNPRLAGVAYRELHERLARFFRFNQALDPETLADEALDRLAQRVTKADEERIESPQAFALGIARHLLQEDTRRRTRESEAASQWTRLTGPYDHERESILQAIDHCMSRLREDQRALLEGYYQWQGNAKIKHHRDLAQELGLTLNALRNRLMRTRKLLDQCVRSWHGDVFTRSRTHDQKGEQV
jgi:DNA-directed RNA polymerase specialized sigma24 family protein